MEGDSGEESESEEDEIDITKETAPEFHVFVYSSGLGRFFRNDFVYLKIDTNSIQYLRNKCRFLQIKLPENMEILPLYDSDVEGEQNVVQIDAKNFEYFQYFMLYPKENYVGSLEGPGLEVNFYSQVKGKNHMILSVLETFEIVKEFICDSTGDRNAQNSKKSLEIIFDEHEPKMARNLPQEIVFFNTRIFKHPLLSHFLYLFEEDFECCRFKMEYLEATLQMDLAILSCAIFFFVFRILRVSYSQELKNVEVSVSDLLIKSSIFKALHQKGSCFNEIALVFEKVDALFNSKEDYFLSLLQFLASKEDIKCIKKKFCNKKVLKKYRIVIWYGKSENFFQEKINIKKKKSSNLFKVSRKNIKNIWKVRI